MNQNRTFTNNDIRRHITVSLRKERWQEYKTCTEFELRIYYKKHLLRSGNLRYSPNGYHQVHIRWHIPMGSLASTLENKTYQNTEMSALFAIESHAQQLYMNLLRSIMGNKNITA